MKKSKRKSPQLKVYGTWYKSSSGYSGWDIYMTLEKAVASDDKPQEIFELTAKSVGHYKVLVEKVAGKKK